jgi:hypothetical protein
MPTPSATVAIVDARRDIAELLGSMLSAIGVRPVDAYSHLNRGLLDFVALMAEYKPRAIVWHAGPPYSDNWMYLQLLRASPALAGCRVFITTSSREEFAAAGGTDSDNVEPVPADVTRVFYAIQSHFQGTRETTN